MLYNEKIVQGQHFRTVTIYLSSLVEREREREREMINCLKMRNACERKKGEDHFELAYSVDSEQEEDKSNDFYLSELRGCFFGCTVDVILLCDSSLISIRW